MFFGQEAIFFFVGRMVSVRELKALLFILSLFFGKWKNIQTLYETWHRSRHERITWEAPTNKYVIFQYETSLPTHLQNQTINSTHIQFEKTWNAFDATTVVALFSPVRPAVRRFFIALLLPFTNFSTKCTFNYIARDGELAYWFKLLSRELWNPHDFLS